MPFLSVLSGYFWSYLSYLPYFLSPKHPVPLPSLFSSFNGLFLCFLIFCFASSHPTSIILCLHPFCHRHLTSVSWDRQRQQMPTECSADRWGQFTCLERPSALPRSWLSISWVQVIRLEGKNVCLLQHICIRVLYLALYFC